MQKTKITQKDFDEIYEIEEGITEETEVKERDSIPEKQDTTPDLLTKEEQQFDDELFEEMQIDD